MTTLRLRDSVRLARALGLVGVLGAPGCSTVLGLKEGEPRAAAGSGGHGGSVEMASGGMGGALSTAGGSGGVDSASGASGAAVGGQAGFAGTNQLGGAQGSAGAANGGEGARAGASNGGSLNGGTSNAGSTHGGATSGGASSIGGTSSGGASSSGGTSSGGTTSGGAATSGGGTSSGGAATTLWNDFSGSAFWATFDVSSVSAAAKGFAGGVFDGRYLYFAPFIGSVLARYDSQAAFTSAGSWNTFDVATVSANPKISGGAAFDGRYLYLTPYKGSLVFRCDTQAPFGSAGSWTTFDLSPLSASITTSVSHAVFDGRYLYVTPSFSPSSQVLRYDTQASFTAQGSWSSFDASSVNSGAGYFQTATFDGRYLYLVSSSSLMVRYDTRAVFGSTGSWSAFDLSTIDNSAFGGNIVEGFGATAFDGRYLYFADQYSDSLSARYDTQGAFGAVSSWTLTALGNSAAGAIFDGRFVYFTNAFGGGAFTRYDSTAPFTTLSSWKSVTWLGLGISAGNDYGGMLFDGTYLYLVPTQNGSGSSNSVAVRLDAKSPKSLPYAWLGTFF